VVLTIYATSDDLTSGGWVTTPPADVDRYLRAATFAVAEACNRSPYDDAPTDTTATALRDATCAQVAGWLALGIDPDRQGVDGPKAVKSSKILTGSVEYDTSATADAIKSLAEGELVPQAEAILQAAGLLWQPTATGDPCPALPTYGLSGPRFGGGVSVERANLTDAWWLA
jgi:hypothetical protein